MRSDNPIVIMAGFPAWTRLIITNSNWRYPSCNPATRFAPLNPVVIVEFESMEKNMGIKSFVIYKE